MKKRWLFILTVLMIAATMFVACNSDIADTKVSAQSGKELVYATFGNSSSKALTVNYDFINYTKLYWFYQATKEDHYGTTGEVIGNNWAKVPGDANRKGLDGTVGPFSQGLWAFKLRGYETEYYENPGEGNYDVSVEIGGHTYYYSGLVYSGASIGTVSLKYGDSNAIPVTVQPSGNTGKIYLNGIIYAWDNNSAATGTVTLQIKVTPVEGTPWTYSKEWVYDSGYTLTGYVLNRDSGVEIPNGTYNLDFTVCAIVDNDVAYEFAKQSLSLKVFGSQTTTVTGSLKEGLFVENAHFVATDVEVTIGTEKKTMSLVEFAKKVNDGEDGYSTASVKLLEDVDLTDVAWTPIGNDTNPFSGVFDGMNHTISNIKVNISSKDAGLFGVVRGQDSPNTFKRYLDEVWDDSNYSIRPNSDSESNFKTVIKNIRLSEVDVSTTDAYAGALAGYTIDTYISNIVVSSGKVNADKGKVGGITGSSNGCSVLNELETGSGLTVSSKKHTIGGIVGSVQRKYSDSDHQAVIRTNTDHAIIIENCTNNATVNWPEGGSYDGGVPIAGIVGNCGSISEQLVVIIYKCTNNGAITADKCSYASGIVGQTGVQVKKIYGCVNNGKVTADASYSAGVGGVAGIGITGGGDVIKCSNTGTLTNSCTGGYVFSITSSGTSIKITGDSFDSVDGLKTAIDKQYHPGITSVALKNVTVKDTEGSLSLPSTIESISSDTKVCNEVNLTASASLATINMVGLNQVVNCERSLSFGGENNIITVPENTTIGDITLNGTNNTFINNGTMNILSYGRTGSFTVTNNGSMKGLSNTFTENSDANMTFTNNGTVERNDGNTIHIECGGYLRINNYGTIANGGSGYSMLLYNSCNVDIYAYSGSIVTGGFAPYSEDHQVHVFYKEGTTIDGGSWTTVASQQYHVTVEQF